MSKKIKKKNYYEFLGYFRYLKNAGLILSGDFYKPRVEQMTMKIEQLVNQLNDRGSDLLKNVIDETERNLYNIAKEDRESYLTGMLKDFVDIAPYWNYTSDKVYGNEYGKKVVKIGDKTFPGCIDDCHKLIIRYELKYTEHFEDLTSSQQYVILCYRAYSDFINRLNAMCNDFAIDLLEIQKKKDIKVFDRNMSSLQKFGLTGSLTHDKSNDHRDIKRSGQLEKRKKEGLSINQIALLHVYQGILITRENSNDVAKKYGHTSGEKLYQKFIYYSSTTNRKGKPIPCTPKKLQNKINLIESVIKILTEDKQNRAKDEVLILQSLFNSEYQ